MLLCYSVVTVADYLPPDYLEPLAEMDFRVCMSAGQGGERVLCLLPDRNFPHCIYCAMSKSPHKIQHIEAAHSAPKLMSSTWRQKGLTGYCFKYTDRPFCLRDDDVYFQPDRTASTSFILEDDKVTVYMTVNIPMHTHTIP